MKCTSRTLLVSTLLVFTLPVSLAQTAGEDTGSTLCFGGNRYVEANSALDIARSEELPCNSEVRRLAGITIFGDRQFSDPGSFTAASASEIVTTAADHPAEILNTLPGVNIHTNSGQEHLIAIRSPVLTGGAGQGSFLTLENGVPTRSPGFGNVNGLLEPHHETAEAIEVVRGPGSAKYGSNAVHGLVNVILADPSGTALKEVRAFYGSLGRYKADAIYDQGYLGRASLSVQTDNGWRDNTGLFQLKGSGVVETVVKGWNVTAFGSASHLEQETGDFIQGIDAYEDRSIARSNDDPLAYRDAWSARGAVRLERDFASGNLTLTPFARVQQMDFRQHFLPNKSFEKNGHTALGLMTKYVQPAGDNAEWSIGADIDLASGYLRETQTDPFGFFPGDSRFPVGVHYDYSVDTTALAVWTEFSFEPTEKLRILAGLRGETHHYDYETEAAAGINGRFNVPDDRSDDFSFVTPKIGAIYAYNDNLDIYANYARGSRAPQTSDLYRIQSLQGTAEAAVETLDSLEFGLRGTAFDSALVFDIAAYWLDKDNFFFRDSNGLNVTDGTTRHQGVEVSASWQVNDTLEISGNVAWSDQIYTFDRPVRNGSEIITDGNQIDTAPEWLADISLRWSPTEKLDATLSAEYVGEYFTNPANTQSYPGHTVFNLRSAYDVSETLETYFIIRNLLDEKYADRADFAFGNERYFPGEPVNVTVGIRKQF
jgi:iron complex outermembrane receptor protein